MAPTLWQVVKDYVIPWIIGASLSEPHTSELCVAITVYIYIYIYVRIPYI